MKKLTIILLAAAVEEISLSSPEFAATLEQQYFFDDYNALSSGDKNSGVYTFESTDIVFKPVTYQELIYLFEQEGNSLILFGGSWCGNTRSAIPYINDFAHEYGIDTIYTFDFRLDGSPRTSPSTCMCSPIGSCSGCWSSRATR